MLCFQCVYVHILCFLFLLSEYIHSVRIQHRENSLITKYQPMPQQGFNTHTFTFCTESIITVYLCCRPSREGIESVSELREIPKTEDFINFLCLRGTCIYMYVCILYIATIFEACYVHRLALSNLENEFRETFPIGFL